MKATTSKVVSIAVDRSAEWIRTQQIATGTNVPPTIWVDVWPSDLSERSRQIILDRYGYYPEQFRPHDWDACIDQRIVIDSDAPTVAEVDAAMLAIDAETAAESARIAERAERQQRELEELHRQDEERIAADKAARELLASEISYWQTRISELIEQRRILSQVLSRVDPAAVVAAIERQSAEALADTVAQTIETLRAACTMPLSLSLEDDE